MKRACLVPLILALSRLSAEVNAVVLAREHMVKRNTSGVLERTNIKESDDNSFAYTSLKSCALVGSSSSLLGQSLGSEIDAQDTVIRVNRLPSKPFFRDFGEKTDVLFGNRWTARNGIVIMGAGSPENHKTGQNASCGSYDCGAYLDCRKGGPNCKFGAMVFKQENANFSEEVHSWMLAPFPVGATAKDNNLAAVALLKGRAPSTGFLAFLTYYALCDELRVYGFDNAFGTADGHVSSNVHPFDLEHVLLKRIADGTFDENAWTEWVREWVESAETDPAVVAAAARWSQEHLLKRHTSVFFSHVDPSSFA